MIDYKSSREKFVVEYLIKHTNIEKEKGIIMYRFVMKAVLDFIINNKTKYILYLGGHLKLQLNRDKISNLIKISKGTRKFTYLKFLNLLNYVRNKIRIKNYKSK